ncbi:MAG: CsbD family protein [Actinobacteria bacterium]|nr:CsbD family protein [Actinomycetota bacterium]
MDPLYKDIKGRLKEAAGALTGNDELRAEGAADQAEAQVEDFAGAVTDKASELTDQAAAKATGYWNQIKGAFDEGKDGK